VQAKLDTCEAAAAAPSWMFVQLADECTLFRDEDGVYHLESNKFTLRRSHTNRLFVSKNVFATKK